MQCYYSREGVASAPVSAQDLIDLRNQGVLGDDTLVWSEGMPAWIPFAEWRAARAPRPPTMPKKTNLPDRLETSPQLPSSVEMVRCAVCQQSWAKPLVLTTPAGIICKACHARNIRGESMAPSDDTVYRVKSSNRYYFALFFLCLTASLVYLFVLRRPGRHFLFGAATTAPGMRAPGTSEKWRDKAFEKWPRIALANRIAFQDGSSLPPSTAFLVKVSPYLTVGVTAGSLFRGDSPYDNLSWQGVPRSQVAPLLGGKTLPERQPEALNAALTSWTGVAGGDKVTPIKFTGVNLRGARLMGAQVLDFPPGQGALPCIELQPRWDPVIGGAPLAIVGASPDDGGVTQIRVMGKTWGKGFVDHFTPVDLDQPAVPAGLIGAPALDPFGRWAGTVVAAVGEADANGKISRVLIECSLRTAEHAEWARPGEQ